MRSFLATVETKARTLWACQPLKALISANVAPPDRFIISNIFDRLLGLRPATRLAGTDLEPVGAIFFEGSVGVFLSSSR
jgi:hypothetical protein